MHRIIMLAAMLGFAPQIAAADILNPRIVVLKPGVTIPGGVYRDGWIITKPGRYGSRLKATPNLRADSFGSQPGSFRLNDTIVLCFTPSADMDVTITDVSPSGQITQIFPYLTGVARATANVQHCIGEKKSAVTLTMDQPSGIGVGKVYLVGVPPGETPPEVDEEEDLPGGFGGSMSRSIRGQTLWEAWIEYRVEN